MPVKSKDCSFLEYFQLKTDFHPWKSQLCSSVITVPVNEILELLSLVEHRVRLSALGL